MAKTIQMVRDGGVTADVHPDEIENYTKGGFRVVEAKAASSKPQKKGPRDE